MLAVRSASFLLIPLCALAQSPGPEVKKFIAYDDAVIALTHVRVIDGTGAPAQDNRTLVLRNGKIESVGDAAPPDGARVIDLPGHSVMPGLVGMHNHLMYTASINLDEDGKIPPPGFLVTELAFSAPRVSRSTPAPASRGASVRLNNRWSRRIPPFRSHRFRR